MAACAAVLTVVMIVLYVALVRQQSDQPAAWALAALILGAAAAGYGAYRGSTLRRAALILASIVLMSIGFVAILSIGFPILAAGLLCALAAARSTQSMSKSSSR
jgi:hypothetical protein